MNTIVVFDVLYVQLLKKKKQIKQCNFEKTYWVCYNKNLMSNNIVSKKRTIQFRMTWNHIISFRKNILCNYITYSILQSKNSIKKNWKYLIFSHINRFDFLTNFNQIKKIRFCIFCIDVCSQCMSRIRCIVFFIDFSIIWHILWIFYNQIT